MTTTPVYDLLRDAMDNRYDHSVTRLAEAFDVPVQSASKWLHENERKRTKPNPDSCEKIAIGLSLDPDYVLELAGHRKPRLLAQARISAWRQSVHAQVDGWIDAVGEENESVYWDYLKAQGDTGVKLIRKTRTAVSESGDTAVNPPVSDPASTIRELGKNADGPLTPSKRTPLGIEKALVAVLATANQALAA